MSPIDFLVAWNAFVAVLFVVPTLFFSYIGVRIVHRCWYWCISFMHPELQFVRDTTFRILSDTHRNKGIIAVLLTVAGPANPDAVQRHLEEVVNRVDKSGNVSFPRLKQSLVTRYGVYAWHLDDKFQLDQNLITSNRTFRGRAISDLNIQDCVSEIASKYLPSGISPWQLVIIPSSENQHYILVRVHHVLISEGLNIADLLPLQPTVSYPIWNKPSTTPLRNVFKEPTGLYELRDRLQQDLTNYWNEFIAMHDPLENPEVLKSPPGVMQYAAIVIINIVSTYKEYTKGLKGVNRDLSSRISFLLSTITRESRKRNVTFYDALRTSLSPLRLIRSSILCVYKPFVFFIFQLPIKLYYEMIALYTCLVLQYCDYRNTVGLIYNYVPLGYRAIKDLLYCAKVIFQTPKNVLGEVFASQEIIQTVTLCGRKVVAWSDPIKTDLVARLAQSTNVSESEVVLATCSAGIERYFEEVEDVQPKEISITARSIGSEYLFQRGFNAVNAFGGMLCINLPILDSKQDSLLDNLRVVKKNMNEALSKQQLTYLLSIMQSKYGIISKMLPATLIGIFLRCLSLKYSVCYTEIANRHVNIKQKTTWGKEVTSVIYWRPPQANISISLCLNQYGDEMRLAVMSDAQLAPHHRALVKRFKEDMEEIARVAGVEQSALVAPSSS